MYDYVNVEVLGYGVGVEIHQCNVLFQVGAFMGTSCTRVSTYHRYSKFTTSAGSNGDNWWENWACQYQGKFAYIFYRTYFHKLVMLSYLSVKEAENA